jgi:2,3-bisphosphoglycerate-dependent phosphoglycerate mutase
MAASFIILISVVSGKIEANAPSTKGDFKVTTVFLVRHAEKATTPPEDPPLTEAGNLRSQQLARLLEQAGIKAIYTSQFLRTKQTAEPLAKSLGITPTLVPLKMNPSNPREISQQSFKDIIEKIHERAGDAALVVGHSNTVPEVIKMLGADKAVAIDEREFNNLFIVTVYAKGKAHVTRLKY